MEGVKRKYWWVSHSKTHKHQINGSHIWSPKTDKNGHSLHSFDNMTRVNSGDIVFSYANQQIKFIGVAAGGVYSSNRPKEYKDDWNNEGFQVPVSFYKLSNPLSIKLLKINNVNLLATLLPDKYSPLRKDGDRLKGEQSYLSEVSEEFSVELINLISKSEIDSILSNHVSPKDQEEIRQREEKDAEPLSGNELIDRINNKRNKVSGKQKKKRTSDDNRFKHPSYDRCQYVKKYAYERANGFCELCAKLAPFKSNTDYGERPYLDSHHIEWLANGGPDTIENSVALCPNCHMKMHHNVNKDELGKDIKKLNELYKFRSNEDEVRYDKQ
jgi:predicted HNH restriction endonuclease